MKHVKPERLRLFLRMPCPWLAMTARDCDCSTACTKPRLLVNAGGHRRLALALQNRASWCRTQAHGTQCRPRVFARDQQFSACASQEGEQATLAHPTPRYAPEAWRCQAIVATQKGASTRQQASRRGGPKWSHLRRSGYRQVALADHRKQTSNRRLQDMTSSSSDCTLEHIAAPASTKVEGAHGIG